MKCEIENTFALTEMNTEEMENILEHEIQKRLCNTVTFPLELLKKPETFFRIFYMLL